jgi:hypothetical protein
VTEGSCRLRAEASSRDAVPSAPGVASVRVRQVTSRGRDPRQGDRCRRAFMLPILLLGEGLYRPRTLFIAARVPLRSGPCSTSSPP